MLNKKEIPFFISFFLSRIVARAVLVTDVVHERHVENQVVDAFAQESLALLGLLLLLLMSNFFVQRFGHHVARATELIRRHGRKQKIDVWLFACKKVEEEVRKEMKNMIAICLRL